MRVRFWGTRGSIPLPGPETVKYGGNTPCVEVRTDDGTVLIFDCGTGARKLGLSLARSGPVRAHLFISHTHSDHIHGLPFFVPLFMPGSYVTIYGPAGIDRTFEAAIAGQMDYSYFPIPIHDLPARMDFKELGEGEFSIGDLRVRTQFVNHTSPCLGYRVEAKGASMVYATDHEPHGNPLWRPDRPPGSFGTENMLHPADARHAQFLRDADLVIHDGQYREAEYPLKIGWGHSTVEYAVDVALAAGVKRLALIHHDSMRSDEAVDKLAAAAKARASAVGSRLEVLAAMEGMELTMDEGSGAVAEERGPATAREVANASILVADDDDAVAMLLERTLRRDGYEVVRVGNGAEAVRMAEQRRFDLIMLDGQMPEMDGFTACRVMRADRRLEGVPIVMLTGLSDAGNVMAGFAEGVTDYMTKPFAVSQVRARVRSWLERSIANRE